MLRIPGWASGATLSTYRVSALGRLTTVSEAAPLANGTYHAVQVEPGAMALTIDFHPQIRVEYGWGLEGTNAAAVLRGPLLYALPLEEHYVLTANHSQAFDTGTSQDFDVTSTTPWNYALQLDTALSSGGLRYDPPSSQAPRWDTERPPFGSASVGISSGHILAQAKRIKGWGMHAVYPNTAADPPASPACAGLSDACGELEEVVLVPFGNTRLRIGMLPWFSAGGGL